MPGPKGNKHALGNNGGRPQKFNAEQKAEILEAFERYIEENDLPIVAEFAAQIGLYKSYFYENDEFLNVVKKCTTKKEGALERGALTGQYNPTAAIFSLKQLGWTDRQQIESSNTNHNVNEDISKMTPEERGARINELFGKGRT